MTDKPVFIRWFKDIGLEDVMAVGGKNASLGELYRALEVCPRRDDEILALARWGCAIEEHYSRKRGTTTPMDIEWAKDGRSGELFIVQARPETVHRAVERASLERYRLKERGRVLVTGRSVGTKIASGRFLVDCGIDSISLNPDSVLSTIPIVLAAEAGRSAASTSHQAPASA